MSELGANLDFVIITAHVKMAGHVLVLPKVLNVSAHRPLKANFASLTFAKIIAFTVALQLGIWSLQVTTHVTAIALLGRLDSDVKKILVPLSNVSTEVIVRF